MGISTRVISPTHPFVTGKIHRRLDFRNNGFRDGNFRARFYFLSAAFIAYVAYIVTDGFDIDVRSWFRNQVGDREYV
ncbi:unnamed protein product, partial [Mesorhabditis spiculigera]